MADDGSEDSIFHADPAKVRKIVVALDTDSSGVISTAEIKELFSKLLEIDAVDIPDDHPEIVGEQRPSQTLRFFSRPRLPLICHVCRPAFASLTVDEMTEELCDSISKEQFESYYALTFPDEIATPSTDALASEELEPSSGPHGDGQKMAPVLRVDEHAVERDAPVTEEATGEDADDPSKGATAADEEKATLTAAQSDKPIDKDEASAAEE